MIPTKDNWAILGIRCHKWWMRRMGVEVGTTEERVFLALGIAGEAGELANEVKKLWRDGNRPELTQKILMEMADIYGYLQHLAHSYQVDLDEITAEKTAVLMKRWPEAFEPPEVNYANQ